MKTTTTLTIGCFCVRGKYPNGKTFEDLAHKALLQFPDTKAAKDEIRKDYSEFACTITDIKLIQTKSAEINLASEYLKAQKENADKFERGKFYGTVSAK